MTIKNIEPFMIKIIFISLTLIFFTSCSGKNTSDKASSQTEKSPEFKAAKSLVDQSISLIENRKYNLAESKLEKAIQILPHSADSYYWLAYTNYYQGNFNYALELLDKADLHADPYFREWTKKIGELRDIIRQEMN